MATTCDNSSSNCKNIYDAIVVGTGFGGAVTACRLIEAELNVCVLERGRRYLPGDFPVNPERGNLHDDDLTQPEDRTLNRALMDIKRNMWSYDQGLWDIRDLGDIISFHAAGYGGGSLNYANVHIRPPEDAFDCWPIKREDLDDYFDLAAYMLDVESLPVSMRKNLKKANRMQEVAEKVYGSTVAKNNFKFPPLAINFHEKLVTKGGVKLDRCIHCGQCSFGCNHNAKNTLDKNYLAKFEKELVEGKTKSMLQTMAEVTGIAETTHNGHVCYEVTYTDHITKSSEKRKAYNIFLAAGSLGTTELLHRNRENLNLRSDLPIGDNNYFSNAEGISTIFDCEKEFEVDRGPTISSTLVYKGRVGQPDPSGVGTWFQVQDGGVYGDIAPLLGIFRSPVLGNKNRFLEHKDKDVMTVYKMPYAHMPLEYLTEAISTHIDRVANDNSFWEDKEIWSVLPEYVREQYEENRQDLIDSIVVHSESIMKGVFDDVEISMDQNRELNKILENESGFSKLSDVKFYAGSSISRSAIRLAAQIFWGSEADMIRAIGNKFISEYFPEKLGKLAEVVILILKWILDYRVDDGRTALLLTMGRDTKPASLNYDMTTKKFSANVPKKQECAELRAQERLVRNIAEKFSGELRTDPASTLLGKRLTVHSQGGCSMPRSDIENAEQYAVTDQYGLVTGTKGLYVVDAAAFPYSVGMNPSATICALAEYKVSRFIHGYHKDSHSHRLSKENDESKIVHSGSTVAQIMKSNDFTDWFKKEDRISELKCLDELKECEPMEDAVINLEFNEYVRGYISQKDLDSSDQPQKEYYRTAMYAGMEDGIEVSINAVCQFNDLEKYLFEQQQYSDEIDKIDKNTPEDFKSLRTYHLKVPLAGNFHLTRDLKNSNVNEQIAQGQSRLHINNDTNNENGLDSPLEKGTYIIESEDENNAGSYVKFFKKENPVLANGNMDYSMYYRIQFSNKNEQTGTNSNVRRYYLSGTKFLTGVNQDSFLPESTTLHLRLYKVMTKEEADKVSKTDKNETIKDWLDRLDIHSLRKIYKNSFNLRTNSYVHSDAERLREAMVAIFKTFDPKMKSKILTDHYQLLLAKGTGSVPLNFIFREGLPRIKVYGTKDKSQQSRSFGRFLKFFLERFSKTYGPSIFDDVSLTDTVKRYFDFKQ